jgi:hypothetical protein
VFLSKCGYFENRTMAINTVVMSTNSYTTWRDSPSVLLLIHDPGATDTETDGFASFNPQVDGDRYVSTGYSKCFTFGGRAVGSDGLTQVEPIEGTDAGRVACDPGPSTDTYNRVVDCLQAGCRLDLVGDVMSLSTSAGEPVADLIRTADEIPPP